MSWGPQEVVVRLSSQPDSGGQRAPTPRPAVSVVASLPPTATPGAPGAPAASEPGYALAAPISRPQLLAQEPVSWAGRAIAAVAGGSADEGAAYWRPVQAKGELGLLEALHRRRSDGAVAGYTGGNADFLLVHARPDAELGRNFSNNRNERVDLNNVLFKYSKATRASHQVENLRDDLDIRGRDVKRGLQRSLSYLQDDEFYLVKYRDYSAWATSFFRYEVRRDTAIIGAGYVERYFAVRVGQQAGVFLPLSEAQFHRGWELIRGFELSAANTAGAAPPPAFLNADQFRGLGGVDDAPPGTKMTAATAKARGRDVGGDGDDETYDPADPPPVWWDYSPRALSWRSRRFLKRQYTTVGQFVVKGAIVVAAYFGVRYMLAQRTAAKGGRGGQRYRGGTAAGDDMDAATAVGSLATAAATAMLGMPLMAANAVARSMRARDEG